MKTKARFSFLMLSLAAVLLVYYGVRIHKSIRRVSAELHEQKTVPTVVIDAGHGGADGGAVACDGTPEKEFNLQIARYLEEFLHACGVRTLMTRTADVSIHSAEADSLREKKVSDIHNRMAILEKAENAVFVSIHQNQFADPSQWGAQVFYSPNTTDSAELAQAIQENVKFLLQPRNGREIKKSGSNIYLLYYAKKPAVLVECGFISNPEENRKLKTPEYQKQVAFAVACGIMRYLNSKVV